MSAGPDRGSVRISGPLARAAQCRVSPGSDDSASAAWLCVELGAALGTVHARWLLGTGAAAVLAGMHTARSLPKGATVTVHAQGLFVTPNRQIELIGVHLVEHHAHITPHHQAAERQVVAC